MKNPHQTFRLEPRATYRIGIRGKLDESWAEWFSGFALSSEQSTTTLTGDLPDQAALRGVLNRIWDLNLTLISLTRVASDPKDET